MAEKWTWSLPSPATVWAPPSSAPARITAGSKLLSPLKSPSSLLSLPSLPPCSQHILGAPWALQPRSFLLLQVDPTPGMPT